ncbi:MAG: helix-turn-helix transcriptional regulator [Saprospiraceae bacterium]|nr:helix-turn-helix transcriptional regulator [Saprospiraceae bacterium]
MKQYPLGEFEEVVLLTVGVLYDNAYGVAIKDEIERRLERTVSVGAMQSALIRMEKKGYLNSRFGEKTNARGGRRKRYYFITPYGKKALQHAREVRNALWKDIPGMAWEF